MTHTTQAILFDLDGTLVDSTIAVERQWGRWAARHGIALEEILKVSHGVRAVDTMRRFAPHIDIEAEAAEHVAAEERETEGTIAVPGALELLASLPAARWNIVTSCPRGLAVARLGACGLPVPPDMVVAEDVTKGKPDPQGYLLGAARLGFAPEDCIVFEDTPAGLAAGHAAGMRVVGVTTTFPAARLGVKYVADYRQVRCRVDATGLVVEFC